MSTYFYKMALDKAHAGYEYQDLITIHFILDEILNDFNSEFVIDKKENSFDKFDDLTIIREDEILKKQIKYSDTHTIQKTDLSTKGTYDLAIDLLYNSWLNYFDKDKLSECRLCLAWNEPIDELKTILIPCDSNSSFKESFNSKTYKINLDNFWKDESEPLKDWRRFNKESKKINKDLFKEFCNKLIIEVNLPKFSLNLDAPHDLEKIILSQSEQMGIGVYPNNSIDKIDFILRLSHIVKRKRVDGSKLSIAEIFNTLKIKTDYGSIKQTFPINYDENVYLETKVKTLYQTIVKNKKSILTGEPGSGKSWLMNNLIDYLDKKDITVIKHYCYTDLEDELQKERIKLDVFYGNLISEIIKKNPSLKKEKSNKFGSNLSELNNLLEKISDETLIIVDGLDHISRIYNFRSYPDVNKEDIQIIENLNKLCLSDKVNILVTSQLTPELIKISFFKKIEISNWNTIEVKKLLKNNNVKDVKITEDDYTISKYLHEKSNGNPLYLSYLIKEIKKLKIINKRELDLLPAYTYNLESYYSYILTKLNTNEQLPRILSGVNFSLTKIELMEITGEGDNVDLALEVLSPILKNNFSRNGYIIYHESFRRYIINNLTLQDINLEKVIFRPIIEWFEDKGLYEYQKSFRYFLPFLYDSNKLEEIQDYISKDYVLKALFNGHAWDVIEKNYKYFAYATTKNHSFTKIITLIELGKMINTVQDSFYENYNSYINALGHLRGFNVLNDYLSFEGEPTLGNNAGLITCYACSINNQTANWELYFSDNFPKNTKININDFYLYIRYQIDNSHKAELLRIAKKLKNKDLNKYVEVFKDEIQKASNLDFIKAFKKSKTFKSLYSCESIVESKFDTSVLIENILSFENVFDKEQIQLDNLFKSIENENPNSDLIDFTITKFSNINWFYNWVIFYIKINLVMNSERINFIDLKETFKYLINDIEPFKGKPRTCDLYQIEGLIFKSIKSGLAIIQNNKEEWTEIINILVVLSNTTSTSLQGSQGGPLSTDKLFKLLDEVCNDFNISHIIKVFEEEIDKKKQYHFHSYISEYYYFLSKAYSKNGNFLEAEINFKNGIRYSLGYTFRKDISISDLLTSLEYISFLGEDMASDFIRKVKCLVDSVVDHTDGRETRHYPITWFEKYLNFNFFESSLFLMNELDESRIDWRLEKNLFNLLNKANGNINPIIEALLLKTFIIDSSEEYLSLCLTIVDKINLIDNVISKTLLNSVFIKTELEKGSNNGYSNDFLKRLSFNHFQLCDFVPDPRHNKLIAREKKYQSNNQIEKFKLENKIRKEFLEMDFIEIKEYLSQKNISKTDLHSLMYYFDSYDNLDDNLKILIKEFVNKDFSNDHIEEYEILFSRENDIAVFYWVSCFIYERRGYYQELFYLRAYERACEINKVLAKEFLAELLYDKLDGEFHNGVSGNLISAFIKVNENKELISEMIENIHNVMSERLPALPQYDWEDSLKNELDLNQEEVLICILFTRFNHNTVEKYEHVISGISYLLYNSPELMIKPLKWFFNNNQRYLKCVLSSILSLLYEYNQRNIEFKNNFTKEIDNIYPKNDFLIDSAIELIYLKPKKRIVFETKNRLILPDYFNYSKELSFVDINMRNRMLFEHNPTLFIETIHNFLQTKNSKYPYEEFIEVYANRSCELMVPNLYYLDYILELLNSTFYETLKKQNEQDIVYEDLKIDIKLITGHINSTCYRPINLLLPSLLQNTKTIQELPITNSWVRIGHFERQIYSEKQYGKIDKECTSIGYLVFKNSEGEEYEDYYRMYDQIPDIFTNEDFLPENDEHLFMHIQKKHHFEDFKLIWFTPDLFKALNLRMNYFYNGISACNEKGEEVLKFNSWKTNYVGRGSLDSIKDEIAKNDGSELIMRQDLFDNFLQFIGKENPQYKILKY